MYEVFRNIFNKNDLWVSIDRYGIMRPTKNVPSNCILSTDGEIPRSNVEISFQHECLDHPEWKTLQSWLHWDLNPWIWTKTSDGIDYKWEEDFIQENNGSRNIGNVKLQGFLNLVDNHIGDGGFSCIPGFNTVLREYCEKTKDTNFAKSKEKEFVFIEIPADDPMQSQIQNISLRAGSLLIWSSELPHCNYPNDSNRFRIVQYVKMFEAQCGKPGTMMRESEVRKIVNASKCELSDLGKCMLGLEQFK